MKNIVIIGATSALAQAFARRYPTSSFVLVGRSSARLQSVAADLVGRGATASVQVIPSIDASTCRALFATAKQSMSEVDLVLIAQGVLVGADAETENIQTVFKTNVVDVTEWIYATLELFGTQKRGKLVVFSSVAGDRGRAKNALYGSSKAAISTLIEGLRQRHKADTTIAIYDIKPGPIDTPMTKEMEKSALFSTSDRVGDDLKQILENHPRGGAFYTPWWWGVIMRVIRWLPESIFFTLKF